MCWFLLQLICYLLNVSVIRWKWQVCISFCFLYKILTVRGRTLFNDGGSVTVRQKWQYRGRILQMRSSRLCIQSAEDALFDDILRNITCFLNSFYYPHGRDRFSWRPPLLFMEVRVHFLYVICGYQLLAL